MDKKISAILHDIFGVDKPVVLTRPEPQFGDYATNIALQLAGQLGKNPREIAEEITAKLRETGDYQEVTVAGPGFINILLSDAALAGLLKKSPSRDREGETVVIETNNPNPFKAMHIGHAFNAILADTIANLLETDGAHTYRVSYHGDVGLHVGKSMYSFLRYIDGDIEKLKAIPADQRNSFMSKMYAGGAKTYKEDPSAKVQIDDLAQQSFESKSAIYAQVYDLCKAWSFEQIDALVERLGNQPTVYRFLESDADYRGVEIVKRSTPSVFKLSEGAYVFEGSKHGSFDNVFVGSNGRGLYGARDLGLMQLKNEQFHPRKSYIVTAEEQRDYFKGVIAAAELCLPELKGVTANIPHGTVKLTTGKMSSRNGDVVEINWLFEKVAEAIKERGGEPTDDIIAGALRYQFLKVKIGSDVVFDINEAVSLHGNSGSYLQYAHARAKSILQKSTFVPDNLIGVEFNPSERALVRKLTEYSDIVNTAKAELLPHHLCTYLYELAQEFNRFYEKNHVIGDKREKERLSLVHLYSDTLARGLAILGIKAPEKM